jgi:hypothetical protein
MLFGFLSFLPLVGPGFALIADWLLGYVLWVSRYFSGLPYANIEVRISAWIAVLLILAGAGLYALLRALNSRLNKAAAYDKI